MTEGNPRIKACRHLVVVEVWTHPQAHEALGDVIEGVIRRYVFEYPCEELAL